MTGVLNLNPEQPANEAEVKKNLRAVEQGLLAAGLNRREYRMFNVNGAVPGFEANRHSFTAMGLGTQIYFEGELPSSWIDGLVSLTVHYSGDTAVAASVLKLQWIATRYKDGDVLTPGTGEGEITPTETVPGVTTAKALFTYTFAAMLPVLKNSTYFAHVLTRVAAGDTYVGGTLRILSVVLTYKPNRRNG